MRAANSASKEPSKNNLNTSCCGSLVAGAQSVVPFAVKFIPLDGQLRKFLVGHLEAGLIGVFVQFRANVEPFIGGRAADQVDHDLATDQGATSPVVGDVAEHPMFDLVPLAGSRWKVANLD